MRTGRSWRAGWALAAALLALAVGSGSGLAGTPLTGAASLLPSLPTPTLPLPTVGPPLPSLPTPTLPLPSLPLPSLPTPTLPLPSLPTPTLPLPSLPTPTLPLPLPSGSPPGAGSPSPSPNGGGIVPPGGGPGSRGDGQPLRIPPLPEGGSVTMETGGGFGWFGMFGWAVPGLFLGLPGLLMVIVIAIQVLLASGSVPVARRALGEGSARRRRRRPAVGGGP